MRSACVLCLGLTLGCATTVARLGGEVPTPIGPAETECERDGWLVIAPTRADFQGKGRDSGVRDDGVGLYRVGATSPESIPGLADEFDPLPSSIPRHAGAVERHDSKRLVAGGLGAAGIIVTVVGGLLFASAFTSETRNGDETQGTETTPLVLGSLGIGLGFGLGIAGVAVNPGQAERSRADAARYVFLPPDDPPEEVNDMVDRHNQRVRERCARAAP